MSGTATAAIAAARIAASVVQQVASAATNAATNAMADQTSGASSFGKVLQGGVSSTDTNARSDELKNQFVESARKVLEAAGVGLGEAVSLRINQSGQIELAEDNSSSIRDQSAQIEAVLAADPSILDLASAVRSAAGTSPVTIELPTTGNLTIPLMQANIASGFGG